MKNIVVLLLVFILAISCKKKYTCVCTTFNTQGIGTAQPAFINEETYHVKEKNKTNASITCSKKYEESGKATGGINCDVTKN